MMFTRQQHEEWLLPRFMNMLGGDDINRLLNMLTRIKDSVKGFPELNFMETICRMIELEYREYKLTRDYCEHEPPLKWYKLESNKRICEYCHKEINPRWLK